jgi:hypothetical protein
MKKSKILVVANWKMNPDNSLMAKDLFLSMKKTVKMCTKITESLVNTTFL